MGEETLGRHPGGRNCLAESYRTRRKWTEESRRGTVQKGPAALEVSLVSLGIWKSLEIAKMGLPE